ncbi:unnamed protein product [Candidula unifasciata]|uniref:Uncharacterized protein n=1 Tax=Candidula unifasciata TaxID=100452 RepID=A0A8S3YV57_9EUPU|nr:unnamed protein product [Candidula unifasciata]
MYVTSIPRAVPDKPLPRAKSISDLKEQSLQALSSSFIVGTTRSRYNSSDKNRRSASATQDTAIMKMISDNFQTPGSETGSLNSSSSLNSHNAHAPPVQWPGVDIYQPLPGESSDVHNVGHGMLTGGPLFSPDCQSYHTMRSHSYSRPPSPPLPPPPMPSNFSSPPPIVGGSATVPNTPMTSSRPRSNSIGTYLPHAPHNQSFSIPPPPKFDAPLPPATPAGTTQTSNSGRPVPPPVSQKTTSVSSMTPHVQTPQTPNLSNHIPPPPPPPPPAPTMTK